MVYLAHTAPDNVLAPLQAAAATWRIAYGDNQPARGAQSAEAIHKGQHTTFTHSKAPLCANAYGFSLYAGVRCEAHDRQGIEQLCRYITRPAISNERLSIHFLSPM